MKKTYFFVNYTRRGSKGCSGGEKSFIDLAKYLSKHNKVIFLTTDEGEKYLQTKIKNVEYFILPRLEAGNVIFTYLFRILYVFFSSNLKRRLSVRFESDGSEISIIYPSSQLMPSLYLSILMKRLFNHKKKKLVVPMHYIYYNPFTYRGNRLWIHSKGMNKLRALTNLFLNYIAEKSLFSNLKYVDSLLAINQEYYHFLKDQVKIRKTKTNVSLIKNAIECPNLYDSKKNKIKKVNEYVYDSYYLGRFSAVKGIFILPEIWNYVVEEIPDAKLAIIGNGDKKSEKLLRSKIDRLGLNDNIFLLGFLENGKKEEAIRKSKIFICPSFYESWGKALVEAISFGKKAICFEDVFISRYFDDEVSIVKDKSAKLFAKRVIKEIKNFSGANKPDFKKISEFSFENVNKEISRLLC